MALFDSAGKFQHGDPLGEDTWELFEAIEDSFAVDLGDYGALCGKTIGQLAEDINEKTNYPSKEKCLSAVSFYQLRRTLVSLFNTSRNAIRPSTRLDELLPWQTRKICWKQIEDRLGLKLPGLVFPGWAFGFALLFPITLLMVLKLQMGLQLSLSTMVPVSLILIIPALLALKPFAREIPV